MTAPTGGAPPPTIRVFLAGQSGSGKSTRAEALYLRRFPRQILLDMTGEYEERCDCTVFTTRELAEAIRDYAHNGEWTIGCSFGKAEIKAMVNYLCPVPNLRESPIRRVRGAVLLVDEVDLIAGPSTAQEEIRTLYRRSRHIGLSVVSTTQRPGNVSREVTAQSQQMVALALSEPRDRDYMIDVLRLTKTQAAQWAEWVRRHPHGCLWKDLQTGKMLWYPDRGSPSAEGPKAPQISLLSSDAEAV